MTKLKRPERCVNFESIKPELREITEFYTRKVKDYLHCLKQLNEYADELENEISVLKETPKVEVLLDDTLKKLVVVPKIVADYIETQKGNDFDRVGTLVCGHFGTLVYGHHAADDRSEKHSELHKWITDNFDTFLEAIVNGYTVEKEKMYTLKHIDLSGQYKNESLYLAHSCYTKLQHVRYSKDVDMSKIEQCHFTQEEIDKLNTGSYEQIEVEP